MEWHRHISRFVTCTALLAGQALCGGGVLYGNPDGLGDGLAESCGNHADGTLRTTPPLCRLNSCDTIVYDNASVVGDAPFSLGTEGKGGGASASRPLAFKTNLLYDLLLVPEIGVEYGFADGWSVGCGWMYGWWKKGSKHRYWRAYGGYATLRRYFGQRPSESPLSGHHVGVYAQLLTYDIEFGGKGYMGGRPGGSLWDKAHYGIGVEYGYSLPITRSLNLDLSIGVGYLGGTYYEYTPMNGHYVWDATKSRHWFGPTKAEVSLVWLFDASVLGLRKGGCR